MAERQLPKLHTRVRFPSPAPNRPLLVSRRQALHAVAATLAVPPTRAAPAIYPARPIRLVIPYTPGGSGDQIGRPWADRMGSLLGTTYIENIGGAGGELGCSVVARDEPDGYSLLLGNVSTHAIIPLSSAHPAYDAVGDFRAIYRLITSALGFVVDAALPIRDMRELIAYARGNPGRLSYGTPGAGTGNHLVGEMLKQQSHIADLVHVPYRGTGPVINDLMGGQIQLGIIVMSGQLMQLHQAGKLRILAVTSGKRLGAAPDIPTAVESGLPDLRYEGWFGLFAAKATDEAIINRIAEATCKAMADPELQDIYRSQGMEPDTTSNPDKFARLVTEDLARLAPIIASIGLKRG